MSTCYAQKSPRSLQRTDYYTFFAYIVWVTMGIYLLLYYCYICLSYIIGFDIKTISQRIQTTSSHTGIVVIVIVALLTLCYFVVSRITLACTHVSIAYLLNITCTLLAMHVILRRLACNWLDFGNTRILTKYGQKSLGQCFPSYKAWDLVHDGAFALPSIEPLMLFSRKVPKFIS
jgi:hypothetical protein